MINFVGAGPGAVDLITVRGQKLLETADQIITLALWSTRSCWPVRKRTAVSSTVPA